MGKNIMYKLIGISPVGWQLPLKDVLIEKVGTSGASEGLKKVKYVPGVKTYFAEDIDGSLKPVSIWFDRGMLSVPKVDIVKNALLKAHPWFNKKYEITSKALEDSRKLEVLRVKGTARKLIEESDKERLRAIALALFGAAAFSWEAPTCELELLQYAERNPEGLTKELAGKDYESRYLSALAFEKGIVKTNVGKTAVQWNDSTEGVILRLAKGEKGINQLGVLLSDRSESSDIIIQSIGERLEKLETKTKSISDKDIISAKDKELSAKDKKIADLMAKLEKANKPEGDKNLGTNEVEEANTSPMSLEEAQAEYKKVFKKDVANSKKNDLPWIISKLKAK